MKSQPDELSIIIDIDKVVFRTSQFIFDVSRLIAEKYNINQELFNIQIPTYYKKGEGNLRLYDFFDHIKNLGLNPDDVEATIINSFINKDYSYPDVRQFLNFLQTKSNNITLLTYGETRFQKLKHTCAPTLHKLNYVDTMQPKTEYIKTHYTDGQGIIIDDKIIDNLPSNFRQIWLTRPDAYPTGTGLRSLNSVIEQWQISCPDTVESLV